MYGWISKSYYEKEQIKKDKIHELYLKQTDKLPSTVPNTDQIKKTINTLQKEISTPEFVGEKVKSVPDKSFPSIDSIKENESGRMQKIKNFASTLTSTLNQSKPVTLGKFLLNTCSESMEKIQNSSVVKKMSEAAHSHPYIAIGTGVVITVPFVYLVGKKIYDTYTTRNQQVQQNNNPVQPPVINTQPQQQPGTSQTVTNTVTQVQPNNVQPVVINPVVQQQSTTAQIPQSNPTTQQQSNIGQQQSSVIPEVNTTTHTEQPQTDTQLPQQQPNPDHKLSGKPVTQK